MQQSPPHLYGALDIGSNSFRLLIGSYCESITILQKELITVRLAEGLADSGFICNQAMQRAIAALHSMADLLKEYNVRAVRICGTEALRRAQNRNVLLKKCEKIVGFPLEIIDGKQEALLCQAGVFSGLSISKDNSLIVDVGGSSTECIFSNISLLTPVSLALGAVSLTDSFFRDAPITSSTMARARSLVQQTLSPHLALIKPSFPTLIASGGSATALASLHLGLKQYDENLVQGAILTQKEVNAIFAFLLQLKTKERLQLPGLDQGRGEILLGGTLVFMVLLDFLQAETLIISDRGLLEGIFLSQFS